MRKRISQFINCRHRWSISLSVIFLFTLGFVSDIHAQSSEIGIEFQVRDQPVNPSVNDEVCFDFTATNLTDDTLTNVVIVQGGVVIGGPSVNNFGLLPNGVTLPGANPATGSGTFVLTGSTCALPTGGIPTMISAIDLLNGFVLGAEVCASGTVGAPSSTSVVAMGPPTSCVTPISCFGVTLTCTDYNISLDAECETLITADLLKINTKVPADQLRIRIQESDGSFRPTPMVDDNDVGKAVKVMVDIPGCSNVAPCWSFANIEYKLGPSQICTIDTVSCAQQIAMSDPIITFSCGNTEFIRGEVIREDLCKVSKEFLAKETITYAVRDQFGNVSDTCTQVRYITKPNLEDNLADIQWPQERIEVSCEAAIFNSRGEVDPRIVGTPQWDGVDLFFNRDVPSLCNVFADYEDIQDLDVACTRTILRRWIVTEWRCEGGAYRTPPFIQRIILTDTTAPVITLPVTEVVLGVNESGCTASYVVPEIEVADNCQDENTIEIEVRYPGGSSLTRNTTNRTISVPLGEGNIIEYIARDLCGNESRDTITVDVLDRTAPVAVCLRETVISITGSEVTMTVDKFDQDSYDACDIDKVCVVRMDDQTLFNSLNPNSRNEVLFSVFDLALADRAARNQGCYRDYSAYTIMRGDKVWISRDGLCTDRVKFCCLEAGKDIPVILRAYDMAGNTNECMVMVGVQDKSDPVITCPTEEIVVSCDFDFDPTADLSSLFGTINDGLTVYPIDFPREFLVDSSGPLVNGTHIDNCTLGEVIETKEIDIDSICRTGEVIRRFSVVSGNDTTQVCEQLIRIVGDQNNNPLQWDYFPGTVRLEAMTPTDVKDLAISDPPTISNVGCSLLGLGHKDQAFHVDSGIYCTKIVRTWQVLDWCRDPTANDVRDSIQFILVSDNDAPEVTLNTSVTVPQASLGNAIEVTATATDNVIDNPKYLNWSYEVFRGSQTTPFITDTLGFNDFRNSSAVIRLEGLTTGDYTINWIVSDQCNNEVEVEQSLTVVDARDGEESNVVGQVLFSQGGTMDQVEVYLTQQAGQYAEAAMSITDSEGAYAFESMPLGGQYFIDPEKNDDPLNGVTTLDLILIQRHILGLTTLEDPALLIAADVNNDFRVTALDLVDLRRLLLGYTENFPKKDSWTFVHDQQALEYGYPLEDEYRIDELSGDMTISFTGIKTGDISGDAVGHSAGISSGRSVSQNTWSYNRVEFQSGIVGIEIVANEDLDLTGFQTNWNWQTGMSFKSIVAGKLDITSDHYNTTMVEEGKLPMSFYNGEAISVNESDVLFTMLFDEEGLSNQGELSVSSERLSSEVYSEEGTSTLKLENSIITVLEELSLGQNTPNPWSETTIIRANMPGSGQASFRVYDLHNRLIHQEARKVAKGIQVFSINQEDVPQSGLYFYEVELNGQVARQKMIRVN